MSRNRMVIFGGVLAAVAVVAIGAIVLSTSDAAVRGAAFDYSEIPQSRTDDGAFVLGDPAAPITIVEFADFLCPHCQEYTSVTKQVIEELVMTGQARFEFRMFQSSDRNAITFKLVECAVEQDADIFWEAHDVMFSLTSRGWTQTSSQQFANRLNLNFGELLNCATDAEQWVTDSRLGQSSGVTGTPAIRVRLGDGPLQPISEQFARGGPSFSVLRAAVEAAQ
jgi:protein-disulfide isomerase